MSGELLLSVFTDGALSSFLIPFHSQTAFFAMRAFGEYDADTMNVAAVVGALGGTVGHTANLLLGRLAYWASQKKGIKSHFYDRFETPFRRYGQFLLLASWAPLLSFFTFCGGVFRVPYWRAIVIIFIGQLGYYAYALEPHTH